MLMLASIHPTQVATLSVALFEKAAVLDPRADIGMCMCLSSYWPSRRPHSMHPCILIYHVH